MEKYINAERLKESMFAYYDCLSESANGRPYKGDTLMDYEVVDMIEDCIDNAPTADVEEVKHGKWIKVKDRGIFGKEYYLCSNCKSRNGLNISFNYCFNCGAKMDGGNTE